MTAARVVSRMGQALLLSGLLLAASSAFGSGLDSLLLEGHELHASLVARPLDSFRDLPVGVVPPKNPQLSSDETFVSAIARGSSQGRLDRRGIRTALYARYAAGENELGMYGLEAKSDADAELREKAVREIWAYNARLNRVRVYRKGLVLVVIWHTGVSAECWEAVNAEVAERLVVPKLSSASRVLPHDVIEKGEECHLTPRWSGRVRDKVPSSYVGVRAAQLNR